MEASGQDDVSHPKNSATNYHSPRWLTTSNVESKLPLVPYCWIFINSIGMGFCSPIHQKSLVSGLVYTAPFRGDQIGEPLAEKLWDQLVAPGHLGPKVGGPRFFEMTPKK